MAPRRPHACAWCEAPLPASAASVPGGPALPGLRCRDDRSVAGRRRARRRLRHRYRPASGRFGGPGDALLARSRALPARRIDRLAPPGPILDVGSGEGWLVDALGRRGREARGLEREDGDLLDHAGTYAAIVFWHSLEHLRRPGAALDHAGTLLRPGGLLVVALPDPSSLQARLFGERWLALDPPRHLVHVPAATLLRRLADLGLRVETVGGLRGGQVAFGWLHGLVGALPRHPDLYAAIRRPEARDRPLAPRRRAATLAAGTALAPVALAAAAAEAAAGRAGTTYIEARAAA
jgi:SAM-dependent methyltransferase